MKKLALAGLSVLLAVALFGVFLAGCGGGRFSNLSSLTKLAPPDSQAIAFIDFNKLAADDDLVDLYNQMKNEFEFEISADPEMTFMSFDDINYLGLVIVEGTQLLFINGGFNFERLRDELGKDEYQPDEYDGVSSSR